MFFHGKSSISNDGFPHRFQPQGCDHTPARLASANLCEWMDSKENLPKSWFLGSYMEECGSLVKSPFMQFWESNIQ